MPAKTGDIEPSTGPVQPLGARSCIYEGTVRHRRYEPVGHAFSYRIYSLYLDLEDLPRLLPDDWFWSTRHWSLVRFRRSDHLGPSGTPLATAVRDLVEQELGFRPGGAIRLLTQPRHVGFAMNPLSLYFCFDDDAATERLSAVVAEVNNTPWGEQHCYVLPAEDGVQGFEHPKAFHVSPFLDMDLTYRWWVTVPSDRLSVSIEDRSPSGRIFDAHMSLRRRPLNRSTLAKFTLRYPAMTAKVVAAIYFEALRLWWKRCPYYPHPRSRSAEVARR